MKYALTVALLLLLVVQVTALARPEIECPNLDAYDIDHQMREEQDRNNDRAAELDRDADILELVGQIMQESVARRLGQNDDTWNGGLVLAAREAEDVFQEVEETRAEAEYLRSGAATLVTFATPLQDLSRSREVASLSLPGLPHLWGDAMRGRGD